MYKKLRFLTTLLLLAVSVGAWAEEATGTIRFGSATGSTNIISASVTGNDDLGNSWTVTTEGTTSFTPNSGYAQVGSSNKPATSITFTMTLPKEVKFSMFSAKFGGFNETKGSVTLKIDDTSVKTGSLSGTTDYNFVASNLTKTGKTLTVTVTGISKGVKCYNIAYTYEEISSDKLNPSLSFPQASYNATLGQPFTAPTLTTDPAGLSVTYASSETSVATVNENTGDVSLVGAGTTTITASFAGDDDYNASSASYQLTVIDPNAPGTQNNPYTVAQAIANTPSSDKVYIRGIVSSFYNTSIISDGTNYRYYISDDGSTTTQLLVYKGKGLNETTFSNADDLQVGDEVTIYGSLITYQNAPEVASGNYLVSLNRPVNTNPVINASNVTLDYDATSGEIAYTIDNAVSGENLTAAVDANANWISNIAVTSDKVTFTTTANEGNADRTATFTLSYTGAQNKTVTVTQGHYTVDYATLPFEWAGGTSADFTDLNGVTASVGSDYASGNAPYLIKFDGDGKYIQVKTDSQPGKVTIGVKMIGGGNTSTITVQGSADGNTFSDVEILTISGSQNDVLTLETTNSFATTDRYVKLYFTKGSNVGVGAITIAKASTDPVINAANSVELTAEATTGEIEYTISNPVGGTSLTAAEKTDVDWISDVTVATDKVTFTTTVNTGSERTATITLTYGSVTKDVTVTQAEHIDINTYTLISSITSGKHYVIAATTNSGTVAMGGKNASKDYYNAIDVSLSEGTISVASNSGVQEFILYGPNANGCYSIYDPVAGGYLYASSNSSNDLSYQIENDDNGLWEIDFENQTVTAQGANTHNLLRYNSGSPRFSCYTGGQTAIQLYEKVGEATPKETVSIGSAGLATFCSENALDFTGITDVWAYIAKNENGNVTYKRVQRVPARTGVLLRNKLETGAISCDVPTLEGTIKDDVTDNKFIGTLTDIDALASVVETNTNYILNNGANGVGFYKANNKKVGAGKAYLQLPTEGAKTFIGFDEEGEATAISTIDNGQLTMENAYNLQGQKVGSEYKGIVIVNGKKFINK